MTERAKALKYYRSHPVEFVTDVIKAKPDQSQANILESINTQQMTTVRSGHGIGKGAVASWAILWFLYTRPFPKVPCTAPTMHQLNDILWAEISKWLRGSPELQRVFTWTREKIYFNGHPEEWFAVARTASAPDALQGFHAEHVLFVIDEASGVADEIFEPVLGALSTEGAKLLMLGNPTRLTGFFYDSHNKNRSQYKVFHIDGRTSTRVSKDFVEKIINMYGEDSDVFRVRVAGEFPKALPDSFIPMDWCEKRSVRQPEKATPGRIDIGVDVARYGDDSSVLCPVFDKAAQQPMEVYHHNDTMEIAGRVAAMVRAYARKHPDASIHVKIDCDGLGVGVYDRLNEQLPTLEGEIAQSIGKEEYKINLEECHFGGEGGTINRDDPVEYANSTGLMWGTVREALRTGTLTLVYDDMQITQLSNRKYFINSTGKIELEKKDAMKKRGLPSPDIADALALAMYDPYRPSWELSY